MIKKVLILLILPLFAIACAEQEDLPEPGEDVPIFDKLNATINPTEGSNVVGNVTFTREGEDVRVLATITGLEPESRHGFHIHQYGDCSASDGTSAGGHYNPYGMPHGSPTDSERHMGDLGNVVSNEEGVAEIDFTDTHIEMDGPFSILGRGIIVHAGNDDFETQPTGDAGARLGCGVIGVASPDG